MGASINAKDAQKETPLHKAAAGGEKCEEVAQVLLSKGADVNAVNEKGLTPLDIALNKQHAKMVEILKKHGARTS